jgi:uncharacterized protein (TIGR02118 family)
MKKLVALYTAPADADAFLSHFRDVHLPLVEKIPGLIRVESTLIERTLVGAPGYHLLVQMEFGDEQSFKTAMKSPENAAAGADVANFGAGLITLMSGSVMED